MKVAIINRSDSLGGAAVVSRRLMEALRGAGVQADLLVLDRREKMSGVHRVNDRLRARLSFLLERLQIFMGNGRSRENLFKADTAGFGVPLHRDPIVSEADVVCLAWINQGMLSLRGIEQIAALGKPVVWIMHDMWCCTGICHHAGECEGFTGECGLCPLLGRKASTGDLSHRIWRRKKRLNSRLNITYVAVSHWLQERCRTSSLLRQARVEVIPNAFPPTPYRPHDKGKDKIIILIAAARLDDPVKGLPVLTEAASRLRMNAPQVAARMQFIAVGALKNPATLDDFPLPVEKTGVVDSGTLASLYRRAHIVVSSSLYETLPGTLVEGQAYGALPVAFDRGGQADIITDGITGVLVPWDADPAARLAAGLLRGVEMVSSTPWDELQQRLADSVRQRFDSAHVAAKYIRLFEQLLQESAR